MKGMAAHPTDVLERTQALRAFVHEFNNLVLAIGGHCELLIEQTPPDSQIRADLMAIASANERATALAAQLRSHAIECARRVAESPAPPTTPTRGSAG
jgi:signal transduction histidine kinase